LIGSGNRQKIATLFCLNAILVPPLFPGRTKMKREPDNIWLDVKIIVPKTLHRAWCEDDSETPTMTIDDLIEGRIKGHRFQSVVRVEPDEYTGPLMRFNVDLIAPKDAGKGEDVDDLIERRIQGHHLEHIREIYDDVEDEEDEE
jgi:hypothetical protein